MSTPSYTNTKKRKLTSGLSRRPHAKSRNGCQSCKARKIKCSEERPCCNDCIKKALKCVYPTLTPTIKPPEQTVAQKSRWLLPQLQVLTNPSGVTFKDLRLLHHFLIIAYPHLPAGNDTIWLMQVPQIAEHEEYLMHALLGLGASHLQLICPNSTYQVSAMAHRSHAIAGLNNAIMKRDLLSHEADAMLAAAYALTFQSSYMQDGLIEFMTLVRGCALITLQIRTHGLATSFDLDPDAYVSHLEPGVSRLPPIDKETLHTGIQTLSQIYPVLHSQTDLAFFFSLKRTLVASLTSTRAGFVEFASIFEIWFQTSSESFNRLIDPSNKLAQVLLAYYVALQVLMAPVTFPMYQPPHRVADTVQDALRVILVWARQLISEVPERHKQYVAWPEAVLRESENHINGTHRKRGGLIMTLPLSAGESNEMCVG